MTSSIVGTYPDAAPLEDARPRRPVLRPLTEVLPGPGAPAPPDPQAPAPAPPVPPPPDPHAHAMAERVLRCAVEIVGGRRPAHQLTAVLHPVLLDYLTGLHGAGACGSGGAGATRPGRTSVSGRRTGRRGRASSSGAASGYVPTMLLVIEPSCGAGVREHAGRCVRSAPARRRWGR